VDTRAYPIFAIMRARPDGRAARAASQAGVARAGIRARARAGLLPWPDCSAKGYVDLVRRRSFAYIVSRRCDLAGAGRRRGARRCRGNGRFPYTMMTAAARRGPLPGCGGLLAAPLVHVAEPGQAVVAHPGAGDDRRARPPLCHPGRLRGPVMALPAVATVPGTVRCWFLPAVFARAYSRV